MRKLLNNKIAVLLWLMPLTAASQSIVNTKHNLSLSGTGTIKATGETEICVFCHTPHNSNIGGTSGPSRPLWNRNDAGTTYTLYNSSTIKATIGQPDGSSLLCLSCHDGTVALGNVISRSNPISFGAITSLPAGRTNLTTNLADDHPISFVYNSALATANGQLKDPGIPGNITAPVSLDKDGKVQCTSCHDAHDNSNSKFLVTSNQGSALCYACHDKNYWGSSSHKLSNKTWNGSGINPWLHTDYTTVADNACENCHQPHNAGSSTRILNYPNEEDNCMNCHNGNVAAKNVQAQFSKIYKHDVYGYTGVHDPAEPALMGTKHVECVDCHNAHAANSSTATAPDVNGFSAGVQGINLNGVAVNPVQYQYEICFRCHADNPATQRYIKRYRGTGNRRLDFATSNVSYHPVEAAGKNPSVTSLIAPLVAGSKIYCTDCHASDGAGSPAGPHGSNNPALLKYAYDTTKFPKLGLSWSAADLNTHWPLCFQCHNLTTVTTIHKGIHNGHFLKYTSCIVCHDPHGYDGTLGVNGGSVSSAFEKLVNFDTSVIRPNATNGKLIDIPNRKCYFVCHSPDGTVNHAHKSTGSAF